jgi:outer membrane receptor protein involved in Fe transport
MLQGKFGEELNVTVHGLTDIERHRQSAESVRILELERAKRSSADMATVLSRAQGISVQRSGGLGTAARLSLNGLTDDQIRYFIDDVPLELAGYPFGVANVPVNLIDTIEIYSGVVPVRFGADALGGAVNLVTAQRPATRIGASYQVGSFGTYRLALAASQGHLPGHAFARAAGYLDYARNDYTIDVLAPNGAGVPVPARVHRFHDAYGVAGGSVEVGVTEKPWAKRLSLRVFATSYDKEYPHNVVMSVPYGGVTYGTDAIGAIARYEHALSDSVRLNGVTGVNRTVARFLDVSTCIYDWFGHCIAPRDPPGEIDGRPHDQRFWDDTGFARLSLAWQVSRGHALRTTLAPTLLSRVGDERWQSQPELRDPLSAKRRLLTAVTGLEYQLDAFDSRLQNIAFAKHYLQVLASEEPFAGNIFYARDRTTQRFGVGNGLRYRLAPFAYVKAAYEWATRLPRPDEIFGNNVFIVANLQLSPETSHNGNLGLTLEAKETRSGTWRWETNGFLRQASALIVLTGSNQVQSYQNVFEARALGAESAAGWVSPRRVVALDANATYVDFRNTSSTGTFGRFAGDRIPNRPYLHANGALRLMARGLLVPTDEVTLSWETRYIHEFYRTWESIGLLDTKQTIPKQLVHSIALLYLVRRRQTTISTAVEMQNLTDEPTYDYFRVQRPGRAFYAKSTLEF